MIPGAALRAPLATFCPRLRRSSRNRGFAALVAIFCTRLRRSSRNQGFAALVATFCPRLRRSSRNRGFAALVATFCPRLRRSSRNRGFAARCEARLRLAVRGKQYEGLRPSHSLAHSLIRNFSNGNIAAAPLCCQQRTGPCTRREQGVPFFVRAPQV